MYKHVYINQSKSTVTAYKVIVLNAQNFGLEHRKGVSAKPTLKNIHLFQGLGTYLDVYCTQQLQEFHGKTAAWKS